MQAKREQWRYRDGTKVWVGRYRNSHNMPHWHYDCELLCVEQGTLDIFCNGNTFALSAGQAFFVDSEQVHYMHARTPQTVVAMVIFDYDVIKPFTDPLVLASPALSAAYDVEGLYASLQEKLCRRERFYEYETAQLVAQKMLGIFRREPTLSKNKSVRTADRFKELLLEIDQKFEFYDLDAAADFMGMNPAYFSRLFHKLTGMTFSQYLNYVRTENAVQLLKSGRDLSMTEISVQCGFTTIRNFNRIFKAFTGYTPKTMPKDFHMKENFTSLNESSQSPTLVECELLECSDDV